MIYAKQLSENQYCLVNEFDTCVGLDGEIVYHPVLRNGKAKDSKYPEFIEDENE